ncbi:MAG: polyprenyl synthetase family protein [Alphaproteobacteria bacterium]|nr:polyprenyl synthetase family protein [Alphaproteobacteria bacterium]
MPSNALDRLTALLADDLQSVNRTIVARMESPVALIPQLAGYIVASGGKRVRPLLTLAAARLCGHKGTRHIGLAAAVEFIHTATLLHDDVVDESDLRRGQASANELFGNQPSVLVGDFLFARAFQLMVEDGSLAVLKTLSDASAVIAEGEVLQLSASNDIGTSEDTYLRVVRAKTAELFAAACAVGGLVADAPEDQTAALFDYGAQFGMAFQLVDDVLDYSARQARLGKTIGDDFREGKITAPVLIAVARGTAEERRFWYRTLQEQRQEDGDLDQAIELIRRHGAREEIVARARDYGNAALAALERLPGHPLRSALHDVVAFCIDRDF